MKKDWVPVARSAVRRRIYFTELFKTEARRIGLTFVSRKGDALYLDIFLWKWVIMLTLRFYNKGMKPC